LTRLTAWPFVFVAYDATAAFSSNSACVENQLADAILRGRIAGRRARSAKLRRSPLTE
jgi:hypothetical protein